jgi:hypothetical protein
MSSGCGMDYLFPFEFLPGMAATFADYLGMAMLTPALPYWCAEAGMSPTDVATWTGAITTAQYAGAALGTSRWARWATASAPGRP